MQPDSIFKENLESLRMTPPSQAWSKIEAGLNQKKSRFIGLKVAASLALIAITSYLLWPTQDSSHIVETAIVPAIDHATENSNVPLHDKVAHLSDPAITDQYSDKSKMENQKINHSKDNKSTSTTINERLKITTFFDTLLAIEEPSSIEISSNEVTVIAQPSAPTSDTGFKMFIEVNKVNDLYLKKKSTSQATANNQKASGLKRLIDKAQDLKNNQDPLGELRIKKNELFAFNLPSNKKHEREKQIGYE